MGVQENILAYLSVYGKENKYRIASALKIDVAEVTEALEALKKERQIEIKSGRAIIVKGKKPITTEERKRKKPKVEVKEEQPEAQKEGEQPEETETIEKTPAKEEPIEKAEKPEEVKEEQPPTEEEVRETFRVKKEGDERIEGTVKFFNPNKGFGFITGDDGKEYYVHKSALKEGVTIEANDRVSFKPVEGDKGPKAEEVEWVSQA